MGKNSRRRHVDKQGRAAERRRHRAAQQASEESDEVCDLTVDRPRFERSEPDDTSASACRQIEQVLGLVLRDRLWANGWQPDELVGTDALPVLAADDRATAELFDRLVGRTTTTRSSAGSDLFGALAGASAADRAALRESGLRGPGTEQPGQLRDAG